MNDSLLFRFMQEEDIDQIVNIEKLSFAVPWSKESFYNELHNNQFAKYVVLEENEKIIGYCGVWMIVDEAHITNIAVLPEYRGRNLGDALLAKVMETVKEMGAKTVTLEVRVSNTVAQNLYRKYGFKNGGIRKNYYSDNLEDALVMWVNI
ncbi:ribosomal protein S18-alanine N-acetyltransferase [Bacillus sp. CGMCC 1.16607]|uniref:ribosomal protein S18-alanine N-acetyltransferase n=1 Tax=Bacillus sp. CGMCC 1.16607 TaxID=3351842 RepID=UPI00364167A3